jgi:hypothetical protein
MTREDVGVALCVGFALGAGVLGTLALAEMALRTAAAIGAACFTLTVAVLIAHGFKLTKVLETITNRDLDGDGVVGEPPKPRADVIKEDRRQMTFHEMPLSELKLQRVATAILVTERPFSRPSLCKDAKILTQTEYADLALYWFSGKWTFAIPE